MGQAKLTIVGDSDKAQASIVALEKKVEKLQNSMKQVSQRSRKAGRDGSDSFRSMNSMVDAGVAKLGAMLLGWASVTQGIQLASAELKSYMELQKKQGREQVSFSTAFDSALLNMGGNSTPADLEKIIAQVNSKTGATPTAIANSLSNAFSARGDLSIDRAVETVTASLQLLKNVPDAQAPLTGAALDIQKLSRDATAEDAIGLLLATGGSSRVVDPRLLSENIGPGINQAVANGATPQQAASLLASLSQSINDVRGAVTATASGQLTRQMVEFFGNNDFAGNLQKLQSNASVREDFLSNASFELKAKNAIENLLNPTGQTAVQYVDAMGKIPTLENAQDMFSQRLSSLRSGTANQAGDLSQRLDANISKLLLTDDGKAGVVFDKLDQFLQSSGSGFTNRALTARQIELDQLFGGTGLGAAENAVARRIEDIAGRQAAGRYLDRTPEVKQMTEQQQQQVTILRELLTEIRQLRGSNESIDEKTEKPSQKLRRDGD